MKSAIKNATTYFFCTIAVCQGLLGLVWIVMHFSMQGLICTALFAGLLFLLLRKINAQVNAKVAFGCAYIVSFPLLLQVHFENRNQSLILSGCLVLLLLLTGFSKNKRTRLCKYGIAFLVLILAGTIYMCVPKQNADNHIQKGFWSAAFRRVCTDYFSKSFVAWDERVITSFTIEDALELTKHPDNMDLVVGPTLQRDWGQEGARECYKQMTLLCLSMRTREVADAILADTRDAGLMPFSILWQKDGYHESRTGRNYESFRNGLPGLFRWYFFGSIWAAAWLTLLGIVSILLRGKKEKRYIFPVLLFAILQLILGVFTTYTAVDYLRFGMVELFFLWIAKEACAFENTIHLKPR